MSKFRQWLIKILGGKTMPDIIRPIQYKYIEARPIKIVAETYFNLQAVKEDEGEKIEKYAYQRLMEMLAQKMIDSNMVHYAIEDDESAKVRRYRAYVYILEDPNDKMS